MKKFSSLRHLILILPHNKILMDIISFYAFNSTLLCVEIQVFRNI